jgi:hypothetical protein
MKKDHHKTEKGKGGVGGVGGGPKFNFFPNNSDGAFRLNSICFQIINSRQSNHAARQS